MYLTAEDLKMGRAGVTQEGQQKLLKGKKGSSKSSTVKKYQTIT